MPWTRRRVVAYLLAGWAEQVPLDVVAHALTDESDPVACSRMRGFCLPLCLFCRFLPKLIAPNPCFAPPMAAAPAWVANELRIKAPWFVLTSPLFLFIL